MLQVTYTFYFVYCVGSFEGEEF